MWAPPDPTNAVPCPFVVSWVGQCKQTDRSKCRHSRVWPMGKQRDDRCRCGRPAISDCSSAGSFVCGIPICHVGSCAVHGGSCHR